ncbi:hypothetical protein [Sciscionella marina]|uniref:hypothetical protein n=1 Tax=Sciscionella marina TaxID=508770 RepID=UPI00036C2337|nr:hypothetical protein [Sciscionella marina]
MSVPAYEAVIAATARPGVFVGATMVIVALACLGFASVNVFSEATGYVDADP